MALISGISSLSTPRTPAARFNIPQPISTVPKPPPPRPTKTSTGGGLLLHDQPARRRLTAVRAAGPGGGGEALSEKVAESVKHAEEACSGGDAASGECVAAWDEVEELSAAASHARDRKKDDDALENYCKDNPEADECRTYDN